MTFTTYKKLSRDYLKFFLDFEVTFSVNGSFRMLFPILKRNHTIFNFLKSSLDEDVLRCCSFYPQLFMLV